jgi:serine/threonine protein kinase
MRLKKDSIWSSSGTKHVNYALDEQFEGENAPVGPSRHLGSGGFGTVDAVICKGQVMARKRMHFQKLDAEFQREAKILEGIIHQHIIQLVGSYTRQNRLFLLLHPVAECNLREFMQKPEDQRDSS